MKSIMLRPKNIPNNLAVTGLIQQFRFCSYRGNYCCFCHQPSPINVLIQYTSLAGEIREDLSSKTGSTIQSGSFMFSPARLENNIHFFLLMSTTILQNMRVCPFSKVVWQDLWQTGIANQIIQNKTWKYNDKCYKFQTKQTKCVNNKETIESIQKYLV